MKTVTIDIADSLYQQLEAQARQTNRDPAELIRDVLGRYWEPLDRRTATHSVVDIKSFPLGPPSKPWTTRAEMLEGLMDDRG